MKKIVSVRLGLVLLFFLFCSLPSLDFFSLPIITTMPYAFASSHASPHGEAAPHEETAQHHEEAIQHQHHEEAGSHEEAISHQETVSHEEAVSHEGASPHGEAASHEEADLHHEESAVHHGEATSQQVTSKTAHHSSLPLWVVLIPILGALLLFLLHESNTQGIMVTMTCGLTLAISLLMYSLVACGQRTGGASLQGIYTCLPFLPSFGLNLTFRVDPAALVLLVFTCLVWLLVAIYSQGYLVIENHQLRYNVANLCCLGVTLGAFMAGDLFTLYVFFESILLFLYLMVIHREDELALRAAKIYLYFGVFTGLMLLFGIFLFSYFAGTIEIQSAVHALGHIHPGWKYLLAALFLLGFGGKAGVFLEHIWMPSSYGSAPCLTAALSSGIMIEVGAYGIFRTVCMIFAPVGASGSHLQGAAAWATSSHLGYVLIFLGIMTMFLGAVNALFSTQALRLLAYSSVSQMGYIVMGIGCAAYMGTSGAMGLAGALYHIINHALFKVGLFLSIGVVYFHTKELDIRKLGGLWKDMPVAAFTLLVSALAIAGFPLFNGFASKTMLHHAILEAYQHSVHLSLTHTPDPWLRIAEIIFIITAGGTFAYNMKLFTMVFLGPRKDGHKPVFSSPFCMNISLMLFSAGILLLGIFPNWLLETFIGPMLPYFGFDAGSHAYHLIYNVHAALPHSGLALWFDPVKRTILASSEVIHNLSGGSTAILAGGTIFVLFMGTGLNEKIIPPAWSLARYYRKAFEGFRSLCRVTYREVVGVAERIISLLMVYVWIPGIKLDLIVPEPASNGKKGMYHVISKADEHYTGVVDQTGRTKGMFGHISKAAQLYDDAIDKAKVIVAEKGLFGRISHAEEKLSISFDKVVEKRNIFANATKADGQLDEAYDKVIFSRFFWGMLTRHREFKVGLWRYFKLVEDQYDRFIEHALFGLIGSEDLSKIQLGSKDFTRSWFLRMCKRASEIHTGDVSMYITWIAVTLTLTIATLVGFLYIKSFFALIITLTTMVTFFAVVFVVISFFLKR
ncbi:MAG: proton-conducting transporter membrane subunit [bacterium]